MELVIAIVDHGPHIDSIKAGEVIETKPDGWPWTQAELTHPNWRIVRADIIGTHVQILHMDHTKNKVNGKRYPRRKYLIDLTALPNPEKYIGTRTDAIIDLQAQHVAAATKRVA